jgi:DNA adenine methylase
MLRYAGGKFKARRDIAEMAPLDYAEFREPFLGGCNLVWEIPADKKIWLNDACPYVFNYWRWLKEDETAIDTIMVLRDKVLWSSDENKRLMFEAAKMPFIMGDPLAYLMINRYAAQCIVSMRRKNIASMGSAFLCDGFAAVTRPKLEAIREILQRSRLTNLDYSVLLTTPGKNVWVMLDPPYTIRDNGSPLYEYSFSEADHRMLAKRLKKCKHRWLLTIGPGDLTRELYKPADYWIFHRQYMRSVLPGRKKAEEREELLICNYDE